MDIPSYPHEEPAPLTFAHREFLHPMLHSLDNGISEFTFANLYLFRNHYQYRIARHANQAGYTTPIIFGTQPGSSDSESATEKFVMLPHGYPGMKLIDTLLQENCYIKNFPENAAEQHRILLERKGFSVEQDRNNFDYIYSREELIALNGRKYHKKRNLVNAFINNYNYEEKRIDPTKHRRDLFAILDSWQREHPGDCNDYEAAFEAIDRFEDLDLQGCITYTDGEPSAYSMGEIISHGSMFALHFEKAIGDYRGIYQFINRSFATMMLDCIELINREQDLGDPGLRQAKMSYRPTGFIKKYTISHSDFSPCNDEESEPMTE